MTLPTPAAIVKNEPVMTTAFVAGFIVATANLLRTFHAYDLTVEQQQAVLEYFPYMAAVVGFIVRWLVKPMAKIINQTTPVYGN